MRDGQRDDVTTPLSWDRITTAARIAEAERERGSWRGVGEVALIPGDEDDRVPRPCSRAHNRANR